MLIITALLQFVKLSFNINAGMTLLQFGQLSAMAFIQGGGAMNILGPSTYNFMCGMKQGDIVSEGKS